MRQGKKGTGEKGHESEWDRYNQHRRRDERSFTCDDMTDPF